MRAFFLSLAMLYLMATELSAFTANKVWMELRPTGRFRIYVNYTIPELKEMREVWVEFAKKEDADAYYFDLIRGADFYVPNAASRSFSSETGKLDPW